MILLGAMGEAGYLYWFEAGNPGDGESAATPGVWHRADYNQSGPSTDWNYWGNEATIDPPMSQQGTMLPNGAVVPTYPNIATGDTRVNMAVQDAIVQASGENSTWDMLGPGVINTALFIGTVLGAEALYNYAVAPAAAPTVGVDAANAGNVFDTSQIVYDVPDLVPSVAEAGNPGTVVFDVFEGMTVSETPSIAQGIASEAQTLASAAPASAAVQQAAQQATTAATAASAAAQSGSTLATVKGYLSTAAAALGITRQLVATAKGAPYGTAQYGAINPATGLPYQPGINPATGLPYASQYGTSNNLLLPLAAIAALLVLKG